MDFYTKLFLINLIALVFAAWLDVRMLNDKLEKCLPTAFGVWSFSSILSIPAWMIWKLVTL